MEDLYEECRGKLERLVDKEENITGDRNEATTRLQLIDYIFFDCLGWSRNDVVAEEAHGQEYTDYSFSAPRRIFILEAKREGQYFTLPAGATKLQRSIPILMRDFPDLKSALEQVAGYCQQRGVPFGAVCNGHQLVGFVATRQDGEAPLGGKALVFPSLSTMVQHFHSLWQTFSKPGIEDGNLQKLLVGENLPLLPPKLSSRIDRYPGNQSRNPFQSELQILTEIVIEDLPQSSEMEGQFLKECYCPSEALSQYSLVSKRILGQRYSAPEGSEVSQTALVPAVDERGVKSELVAESISRRPLLIIGDVGVGKSTFIHHLIKVDAAPLFQRGIALLIDLGSQATLVPDLKTFVVDEISNQLRDRYGIDIDERNFVRGVYNLDLKRFSQGIHADLRESAPQRYLEKEIDFLEAKTSDRSGHVKAAVQHIVRGQQRQVVVFLDNADQRESDIQQATFLIAQELAAQWPASVFVALRPETFYQSIQVGTLSAYHPKAFTIAPPRIDRVIPKRLGFARKITSGSISVPNLSRGVRMNVQSLDKLITVFMYSITMNPLLVEFLDNISGGNVRIALNLVKDFFSSGHVNTEKILDIYKTSGEYTIPVHELLRAVMYGSTRYYDPSRSPIVNVFDLSSRDPKEHFLVPMIVSYLMQPTVAEKAGGFVESNQLYEDLQGLGFTPWQIDRGVVRCLRRNLVETATRHRLIGGSEIPNALRATTIGAYHVKRLVGMFPYMDAIVIDTPILEEDVRTQLHPVDTISDRLSRADTFRVYLDRQWQGAASGGALFDWRSVSAELKEDINKVRSRIRV